MPKPKTELEFKQLKKADSPEYKKIVKLYEKEFSSDTRREIENKTKLLEKDNYTLHCVTLNKKFAGFIIIWELSKFRFVEHFAVEEAIRGKGIGSEILKHFLGEKEVVLEVALPQESPEEAEEEGNDKTELSKTGLSKVGLTDDKISFYEKLGFKINPYKYIQPAYEPHKKPVELKIMSYPDYLDKVKFMMAEAEIHEKVYGQV